jgi:hypothetical protein
LPASSDPLLAELTAPPVFRVEKHSDEVLKLADHALTGIQSKGFTASDKKTAALAGFLAELENNPFGMVDAVSEFSYAFSATVQQSVNKEMQRRKGISNVAGDESLEYEYVIIDEAARVSPRDLMIPMSQGKKIILVGDHRQLPHIIDEEVAKRMEEGEEDTDESQWLKKSMFQYLFSERLKALEEKDGIQRRASPWTSSSGCTPSWASSSAATSTSGSTATRCSSQACRRRRSRTTSRAPTTSLRCGSTFPASPARASVQEQAGPARQKPTPSPVSSGSGSSRQKEGDLSYGVIAFYKAQADLIRRQLRKQLGPMADDDRKIRVGTVDSFQGMEFDVVFLSVVRTLPQNWGLGDQERAIQARRLFGHLCLYNRLNVSMSRQKKLLVVAGDSALVTNDLATEFIPGLVDFYELAQPGSPPNLIRRLFNRGQG